MPGRLYVPQVPGRLYVPHGAREAMYTTFMTQGGYVHHVYDPGRLLYTLWTQGGCCTPYGPREAMYTTVYHPGRLCTPRYTTRVYTPLLHPGYTTILPYHRYTPTPATRSGLHGEGSLGSTLRLIMRIELSLGPGPAFLSLLVYLCAQDPSGYLGINYERSDNHRVNLR